MRPEQVKPFAAQPSNDNGGNLLPIRSKEIADVPPKTSLLSFPSPLPLGRAAWPSVGVARFIGSPTLALTDERPPRAPVTHACWSHHRPCNQRARRINHHNDVHWETLPTGEQPGSNRGRRGVFAAFSMDERELWPIPPNDQKTASLLGFRRLVDKAGRGGRSGRRCLP